VAARRASVDVEGGESRESKSRHASVPPVSVLFWYW
jgi:hypothetical protein